MREESRLWRVLGHLALQNIEVDLAGNCLVLHSSMWRFLSPYEAPESLVLAYLAKLKERRGFNIDDIAAFALELDRRHKKRGAPRGIRRGYSFPADLGGAGLTSGAPHQRWALMLYASMSDGQKEALRSGEGLRVRDLSAKQREDLFENINVYAKDFFRDDLMKATVRLEEHRTTGGGRGTTEYKFILEVAGRPEPVAEARFEVQTPEVRPSGG
jgi:hypothetical protein